MVAAYTLRPTAGEGPQSFAAAGIALADLSGPVGTFEGAEAKRKFLSIRGEEHSDCGSLWT